MHKLPILGILVVSLVGCEASTVPNFERMSFEELAEYNRGRPLAQMIVCGDDNRSFTRIRRRHCMTVEVMYGSIEAAVGLDVLNSVPGYSATE